MPKIEIEGRQFEVDGDGFLQQPEVWDEEVARLFAGTDGTGELTDTGYPLLSAASRKSFVGAVTGVAEPDRRVIGSTAISVIHWLAGVRLFRVHDVAAHREALAVAAGVTTLPISV